MLFKPVMRKAYPYRAGHYLPLWRLFYRLPVLSSILSLLRPGLSPLPAGPEPTNRTYLIFLTCCDGVLLR
jgi:hypothetical protein